MLQVSQTGILAQIGQHGLHTFGRASNGAVDALACQQDQALDRMALTTGQQRCLELCGIGQVNKFVKSGSQVGGHEPDFRIWPADQTPVSS